MLSSAACRVFDLVFNPYALRPCPWRMSTSFAAPHIIQPFEARNLQTKHNKSSHSLSISLLTYKTIHHQRTCILHLLYISLRIYFLFFEGDHRVYFT